MPDSSPSGQPNLPEQLLRSGVLARDDFERFFGDEIEDGPPTDPERLARELRQQGLVTPHQAKAIAKGRIDELKKFGAYVVLDELGKGGMGRVYKARHPLLKRIVAIKTILASAFEDDEAVRRFENEMEALGRISHSNVVAAQFAERFEDGSYYLVMDYVEGTDLFVLVRGDGKTPPKPLDWRTACAYVAQAAAGLGEAHKFQIIHRDVKPNNLMLSKDGVVKVLDLGLARFADGGKSMRANARKGSRGK